MLSVLEQERKLLKCKNRGNGGNDGRRQTHLQVSEPDRLHHLFIFTELAGTEIPDVDLPLASRIDEFLKMGRCFVEKRTGESHMPDPDNNRLGCRCGADKGTAYH